MPCASSGGSPFPEVLDLGRVGVELAVAQFLASYPGERGVVAPVARELLILEGLEVEEREEESAGEPPAPRSLAPVGAAPRAFFSAGPPGPRGGGGRARAGPPPPRAPHPRTPRG